MEDQRKEPKQQQGVETADYGKEEAEAAKPEELTDQRKEAEPAVEEKEKETERSSDQEESMQDSSPLVHPCSQLLQFVARACARCLGMPDSLDHGGASLNSSPDIRVLAVNKASGSTGFYMQEMFSAVLVQLRRLQPGRNDPRPGKGGVIH